MLCDQPLTTLCSPLHDVQLMERGDKLVNLEGKTDELAHMADEFARTGRQVRWVQFPSVVWPAICCC
jgi:hypothetical protein